MDIVKIQALIAQGRLIDLKDCDPGSTYLQLGIYQAPNSKRNSGDFNTYAPYVISLQDLIGYNQVQDEGVDLVKRNVLNFVGPGVVSFDDPINNKTVVFVPGAAFGSAGLFAQTADSTPIVNTLVLGNLLGTGIGTLSVPPNGFQVGDSFHLKVSGLISSKNNDDITITLRSNGVILASTGLINLPQTTNKVWELEVDFTIRNIGVAGVANINTNGQFIYNKDASLAVEGIGFSSTNNTTFDTTILNTLEVDAQWAQADLQNSIFSSNCSLFKTY